MGVNRHVSVNCTLLGASRPSSSNTLGWGDRAWWVVERVFLHWECPGDLSPDMPTRPETRFFV